MLKYCSTDIVFQEVPGEVSVAINITNCPIHCKGCHSDYLWKDFGEVLDETAVDRILRENEGVTCILFMGGDSEPEAIQELAKYVKLTKPEIKTAWYSGRTNYPEYKYLDYIKLGPYIEDKGPINKKGSNQKLYKVKNEGLTLEEINMIKK